MNGNEQSGTTLPTKFFEPSSFTSLSGSVAITWVFSSAIADLWAGVDPKILGFIIALIVALIGYFMLEQRSIKKLATVPFNGLLIYLTILGATSFLPPPAPEITDSPDTAGTQNEVTVSAAADTSATATRPKRSYSHFFTQWNPDKELIRKTAELSNEKQKLQTENRQLTTVNKVYEAKIDSTRRALRQIQLPAGVQQNLMKTLEVNKLSNVQFRVNH